MNKDQVKGKLNDVAGKAQQKVGEMTGNEEQQAKGLGKQVKGKAQETLGDAKNIVNNDKDQQH